MEAHHSDVSPGDWQVRVQKGLRQPLAVKLSGGALAGPPGLRCQMPTLGLSQWCGCKNAHHLQSILVLSVFFFISPNPLH